MPDGRYYVIRNGEVVATADDFSSASAALADIKNTDRAILLGKRKVKKMLKKLGFAKVAAFIDSETNYILVVEVYNGEKNV